MAASINSSTTGQRSHIKCPLPHLKKKKKCPLPVEELGPQAMPAMAAAALQMWITYSYDKVDKRSSSKLLILRDRSR